MARCKAKAKAKAKAMASVGASSAHTMREKPMPNTDIEEAAPVVGHLTDHKRPCLAARHLITGAKGRNRDTMPCREIVLPDSPSSYFLPARAREDGMRV